jgi:hypothetical protein
MESDVRLERGAVHVTGDLLAVDGRVLIAGDALVLRFDGKDHLVSLRMLYVVAEMASRGALWRVLPPDLQKTLGPDYQVPSYVPPLVVDQDLGKVGIVVDPIDPIVHLPAQP